MSGVVVESAGHAFVPAKAAAKVAAQAAVQAATDGGYSVYIRLLGQVLVLVGCISVTGIFVGVRRRKHTSTEDIKSALLDVRHGSCDSTSSGGSSGIGIGMPAQAVALNEAFKEAAARVSTTYFPKPTKAQQTRLYGLYKHATKGAAIFSQRPGITDPVGRLKYDAWAGCAGLSLDGSKREYVVLVQTIDPAFIPTASAANVACAAFDAVATAAKVETLPEAGVGSKRGGFRLIRKASARLTGTTGAFSGKRGKAAAVQKGRPAPPKVVGADAAPVHAGTYADGNHPPAIPSTSPTKGDALLSAPEAMDARLATFDAKRQRQAQPRLGEMRRRVDQLLQRLDRVGGVATSCGQGARAPAPSPSSLQSPSEAFSPVPPWLWGADTRVPESLSHGAVTAPWTHSPNQIPAPAGAVSPLAWAAFVAARRRLFLTDDTLLRYLRARDGDVDDAMEVRSLRATFFFVHTATPVPC